MQSRDEVLVCLDPISDTWKLPENNPNEIDRLLDAVVPKALSTGHIGLEHLALLFAYDHKVDSDALATLVTIYLGHRAPKRIDNSDLGCRIRTWISLVNRWAGFGAAGVKLGLDAITTLTLFRYDVESQSFKKCDDKGNPGCIYANLKNFQKYVKRDVLEMTGIPLPFPSRLFAPTPKPTLKQHHSKVAKQIAERYWERNPEASLKDAVKYIQERTDPFQGKMYKDSTIQNWIREKNPLYTTGQPARKKTEKQ